MFLEVPQFQENFPALKNSWLRTCNPIKNRLQRRCFPVNIVKFLRTAFSIEQLWWLLLELRHIFCLWYNLKIYEDSMTQTSQQTFGLMKTSWRRFEEVFRLRLRKTSSRCLDQGEYVRLSLTSSKDVFKTSWSRPKTKTSSRRLAKMCSRRFEDVFKTYCKNVFKTSSRRLQAIFKTSSKDIFKTFSRRIIKLNCSR